MLHHSTLKQIEVNSRMTLYMCSSINGVFTNYGLGGGQFYMTHEQLWPHIWPCANHFGPASPHRYMQGEK